jgi:hypothetical protein
MAMGRVHANTWRLVQYQDIIIFKDNIQVYLLWNCVTFVFRLCFKPYDVAALHDRNGNIVPMYLVWADGAMYFIDKILDVRRAASLKAGGVGQRYTCIIAGRERYLFLEEDKWFVEGKD